jgi:arginyl-tRNA synthetase
LGLSVLIRYKQQFNEQIELPEDSYHGEEIIQVAKLLKNQYNDKFMSLKIVNDSVDGGADFEIIKTFAKAFLLNIIKQTLSKLNVHMDI